MPEPTRDHLRAIIHAAWRAPSPLHKYMPNPSRRADHGPLVLVASGGGDGPNDNYAFVLDPVAAERAFALADEFFAPGTTWSIAVEEEIAPDLEAALLARGWQLDEEEPTLVLPNPPPIPAPPADLAIRLVRDEQTLADFSALNPNVWRFVPSLAAATDPEVALFVGYRDDRPVATSRLAILGATTEITGVSTLPEYRRRGYGTALTWAAVAEGAARGAPTALLNASPLGYPVYLRMGFTSVCAYRTYLPPGLPEE